MGDQLTQKITKETKILICLFLQETFVAFVSFCSVLFLISELVLQGIQIN